MGGGQTGGRRLPQACLKEEGGGLQATKRGVGGPRSQRRPGARKRQIEEGPQKDEEYHREKKTGLQERENKLQHAKGKVEEALKEWGEEEEGLTKFLKGLKDEEQEIL